MDAIRRYSLASVTIATCFLTVPSGERPVSPNLQGATAMGGWRDDKPGVRRLITPQDLPAISKPTYGQADVVAKPAGAGPQVPNGFSAEQVTTSGLRKPRVIRGTFI